MHCEETDIITPMQIMVYHPRYLSASNRIEYTAAYVFPRIYSGSSAAKACQAWSMLDTSLLSAAILFLFIGGCQDDSCAKIKITNHARIINIFLTDECDSYPFPMIHDFCRFIDISSLTLKSTQFLAKCAVEPNIRDIGVLDVK